MNKQPDVTDEKKFQKTLKIVLGEFEDAFRKLMMKPEFSDMRVPVQKCGKVTRYTIHPYSFKKFGFTVAADVLGELEARAMKGDKDYVQTYYRKNREERAKDYRKLIPRLSVFGEDEEQKKREKAEAKVKTMSPEQLERVLEL